jgi:phage terminase large subunit-like protein
MLGRLRDEPGRAWGTTTPKGFNWVYNRFVRAPGDNYAVIHATTESNVYLRPEYIEAISEDYAGKWRQQEMGGEFVELSGGVFERQWFRVVPAAPVGLRWMRYYDLAASTKTKASRTATIAGALAPDGTLYLRDGLAERIEWPEQRAMIQRLMRGETNTVHGVEKAMHGLPAVQELRRDPTLVGVDLREVTVTADKLSRALVWQARAQAGKVALVEGAWGLLD